MGKQPTDRTLDSIKISNRHAIGPGHPCFIIAEAGVNHNGDLALARQLIEAAHDAGVDAVKFQTFQADKLVTKKAQQASYQTQNTGHEESQYEMLKRLELPYEAHAELKAYAEELGLVFMSTPFDEEAIDFLYELGVKVFKAGSGELTNIPYLKRMAAKGMPLIISTGMAVMGEVHEAISAIKSTDNEQLVVLHCTTNYPCPHEDANLSAMKTMHEATGCIIGYSDHTEGILVPVLAVAMGAHVIEKHYTLDRTMAGPDHKASLEPDELKEMVRQIRQVEKIMGSGVKIPTKAELEIAAVARKSVVAIQDIPIGTTLTEAHLGIKRPGDGIPPSRLADLIGKVNQRPISKDSLIQWEDVGGRNQS